MLPNSKAAWKSARVAKVVDTDMRTKTVGFAGDRAA